MNYFSQQTLAKQWDSILLFLIKHEQQLSINWQRIKFNEILTENNSADALCKTNSEHSLNHERKLMD